MNEHNLDDLIIGDKPEKSKGKGVLAVFALLIAVLVVAIIMTQMFLSENDENSTVVKESTQEEMISPELQLDTANHNPKKDKEELEHLSSILEDELGNDINLTPQEKANMMNRKNASNNIKPETTQIDESIKESKPTIIPQPTEQKPEPQESKPQQQVREPEPKAEKPKAERPKREEKREQEPPRVQQERVDRRDATGNYYIQVGSFAQEPSKHFLSIIAGSGFRYKLVNGKLLIGPYSGRNSASQDLPRVKDKINKTAFIKEM